METCIPVWAVALPPLLMMIHCLYIFLTLILLILLWFHSRILSWYVVLFFVSFHQYIYNRVWALLLLLCYNFVESNILSHSDNDIRLIKVHHIEWVLRLTKKTYILCMSVNSAVGSVFATIAIAYVVVAVAATFFRCNCVNLEFVVSCLRKFGGVDLHEFRVVTDPMYRRTWILFPPFRFAGFVVIVVVVFDFPWLMSWSNGKLNAFWWCSTSCASISGRIKMKQTKDG